MCVFKIFKFWKILAIFGPVVAILNFQNTSLRGFQCSYQNGCIAKVVHCVFFSPESQNFNFRVVQ